MNGEKPKRMNLTDMEKDLKTNIYNAEVSTRLMKAQLEEVQRQIQEK